MCLELQHCYHCFHNKVGEEHVLFRAFISSLTLCRQGGRRGLSASSPTPRRVILPDGGPLSARSPRGGLLLSKRTWDQLLLLKPRGLCPHRSGTAGTGRMGVCAVLCRTSSCDLWGAPQAQDTTTPLHVGISFRERRASSVGDQGSDAQVRFGGPFI